MHTIKAYMTTQIHDFIGHKMLLIADENRLISCRWLPGDPESSMERRFYTSSHKAGQPIIDQAIKEIIEYLEGTRIRFDIAITPTGTEFRMKVWNEMRTIPYGETITYKELARRIGSPDACRAVANACGANPFPIIIPCHRVVASGGKPGGYTGGLDIKHTLLAIEKQNCPK